MKLKYRIAFVISLFFSLFFGLISVIVYVNFADFRKEESFDRLEEKAITTLKLIVEVQEVDMQLLKLIDQHTIHNLYNEKTIIFDSAFNLIYSSVDDAVIKWDLNELKALKKLSPTFKSQGIYDVYGAHYKKNNQDYYILVSDEDKFGNRKLEYLKYLLLTVCSISIVIVWFLVFLLISNLIRPLDVFQKNITRVSEDQLTIRLVETNKNDEINLMAKAFNQMMKRIEAGYDRQKEFTSSASHELRTPIARIIAQLENLKEIPGLGQAVINYLENISNDASNLVEKVNSLLLLSRIDNLDSNLKMESVRVDEIIFDAIDEVRKVYPELQPSFLLIDDEGNEDEQIEIKCHESILKIAILNLLKNAYLYSEDHKVKVELDINNKDYCIIRFLNNGPLPDESERDKIFRSFTRGNNSVLKPGSGLGLAIVSSIVKVHKGEVSYFVKDNYWNVFEIKLHF